MDGVKGGRRLNGSRRQLRLSSEAQNEQNCPTALEVWDFVVECL